MSKMNILVYLNAYKDSNPSNNPTMNSFKWQRELHGLSVDKPQSIEFTLAPGESKTMFDGQRTVSSDNTTSYDLTQKSSNTYVLKHDVGTAPSFRTLRAIGSDATSEITVTTSGSLVTFQATGGTLFVTTAIAVGDELLIGSQFNSANQGRFKVLSKTTDSVIIENSSGTSEGPIVLGASFADQFRVYSASGVQKGDKIKLGSGFSSISQNTYEITAVQDNLIEFYSSNTLPVEFSLLNPSVVVYSSAKKIIYMETDKNVNITINGAAESKIEPFIEGNTTYPGILFKRSTMWSMIVTNNSTDMATLYFVSVE